MRRFGTISSLSVVLFAVTVLISSLAQAQTFSVIHTFTGGQDGGNPLASLAKGGVGTFYGTTFEGGTGLCSYSPGCGIVFKLSKRGSSWVLTPLYNFTSGLDGASPIGGVTFGPDGRLYGTTESGGSDGCSGAGCGTVFNLQPLASACKTALCSWTENTIYRFVGIAETAGGNLIFDQAGNLYGTTPTVAFEMMPPQCCGWTYNIIHTFSGPPDGSDVVGGLIWDKSGNLYGTTIGNCGTVFQLTPSESGWTENILHSFSGNDGCEPYGGLVFDTAGNLYGTTQIGGSGDSGNVYELTPSNGNWTFAVLYGFSQPGSYGPTGALAIDAAGNLYGTTYSGGISGCNRGCGNVFKLTPSNGGWAYTDLYDFTGGSDGAYPSSGVIIDTNGNLYGTTAAGGTGPCTEGGYGATGCGVVWEITP